MVSRSVAPSGQSVAEKDPAADSATRRCPGRCWPRCLRQWLTYLLDQACQRTRQRCPNLPAKRVSPHVIRHTTAMHLLQAAVDMATIAGIDLTGVRRLPENAGVAFMADTKGGPFDVPGDQAREWLRLPANPNGRTKRPPS